MRQRSNSPERRGFRSIASVMDGDGVRGWEHRESNEARWQRDVLQTRCLSIDEEG